MAAPISRRRAQNLAGNPFGGGGSSGGSSGGSGGGGSAPQPTFDVSGTKLADEAKRISGGGEASGTAPLSKLEATFGSDPADQAAGSAILLDAMNRGIPLSEVGNYYTNGKYTGGDSEITAAPSLSTPRPILNNSYRQNSLAGAGFGGGIGEFDSRNSAQKDAEEYLDESFQKPKTEEEIINERTAAAKDSIASLGEFYDSQLRDQAEVNKQRSAETNAQSVLAGLMGSTEAGNRAVGASEKNTQANKGINAERNMKLQQIYTDIRNNARTEAKDLRGEARLNAQDILARSEQKRTRAIEDVKILAGAGFDLNQIRSKDPETYQSLVKSIGSEQKLNALMVLNRPQDTIIDKKFENGKYISVFRNPITGDIKIETADLGLPASAKYLANFKGEDGNNYIVSEQNGRIVTEKVVGSAGAGGGVASPYGNDLDAIIGATVSSIPTQFGQNTFKSEIQKARNDSDKINLVATQVLKGQPSNLKVDFANQAAGIANLDKAIALLDEGVKTGLLQNGTQYLYNIAGKDFDPKIAKLNQYITSAIQPYRNSITGAAWGDQEDGEYAALFGSTKYSPDELKQRLAGMKEIMKNKSAVGLNAFVNPLGTYSNPFETGNFTPTGAQQGSGQVIEYQGRQYEVDANGNFDPNKPIQ